MMKKCLAFVLGGGGARGALQVGALRALFEAGLKPDLLVGTSIGAVNAIGLALWGVNLAGVEALDRIWQDTAGADFMDPHLPRVFLRQILGRPNIQASQKVVQFFESIGVTPDLRFDQISGVRLALISADLVSGQPVIYGQDLGQSVLDGVLASIALPPWFAPIEREGHHIVDGGALSNLPIEPALTMGATEIIALDLDDPNLTLLGNEGGLLSQLEKLSFAIYGRLVSLETALAEARGVPVHRIALRSPIATYSWDFSNYQKLVKTGYEITSRQIPFISPASQP
jgi:NTE family protein